MAPLIIGEVLIDAALLGILISVFARPGATNDLSSLVTVVAGVTIGSAVIGLLWGESLGWWVFAPQAALRLALAYVLNPE